MYQRLGHTGDNNTYKSENIIGENISTTPSSIHPCDYCSISKIRLQDLLKSMSRPSTNVLECSSSIFSDFIVSIGVRAFSRIHNISAID